eukprot:SAG31_NODE_3107_length_4667_cov_4.409807_6_plen_140_part_00
MKPIRGTTQKIQIILSQCMTSLTAIKLVTKVLSYDDHHCLNLLRCIDGHTLRSDIFERVQFDSDLGETLQVPQLVPERPDIDQHAGDGQQPASLVLHNSSGCSVRVWPRLLLGLRAFDTRILHDVGVDSDSCADGARRF